MDWMSWLLTMARLVELLALQGLGSPARFQQSPDEQGRPRHLNPPRIYKTMSSGAILFTAQIRTSPYPRHLGTR